MDRHEFQGFGFSGWEEVSFGEYAEHTLNREHKGVYATEPHADYMAHKLCASLFVSLVWYQPLGGNEFRRRYYINRDLTANYLGEDVEDLATPW